MKAFFVPITYAASGSVGDHRLSGTLLDRLSEPTQKMIYLFEEQSYVSGARRYPSLKLVRKTKSESDGSWKFDRIPSTKRFTVIAYDDTAEFDPVIKGGLIPEPME